MAETQLLTEKRYIEQKNKLKANIKKLEYQYTRDTKKFQIAYKKSQMQKSKNYQQIKQEKIRIQMVQYDYISRIQTEKNKLKELQRQKAKLNNKQRKMFRLDLLIPVILIAAFIFYLNHTYSIYDQIILGFQSYYQENKRPQFHCSSGRYPIKQSSCEYCIKGCKKCQSANVCTSCYPDFHLVANKCKCKQQRSFPDGGTCTPCIKPCKTCDSVSQCRTCIEGYFLDENQTCQRCNLSNCQVCLSAYECQKCQEGFVFNFNNNCERQTNHILGLIIILGFLFLCSPG